MIKKKYIIIAVLISLTLILIPIFIFFLNFHCNTISNNLIDWANFGDYIGGVINPIISLLSLIILGYITILLSNNSNKENKNLLIYQKRVEAYSQLTDFLPKINTIPANLKIEISKLNILLSNKEITSIDGFYKNIESFKNHVITFSDFYYFIFSFNARFGHFFKYDFNSDEFKGLIKIVSDINNHFNKSYEGLVNIESGKIDVVILELFNELPSSFVNLINGLREELE